MLGKIFNMLLYSGEEEMFKYLFKNLGKIVEGEYLDKREIIKLHQLAKALKGIKVIPPNGSGATFTTDSLSKILEKYVQRKDLVRIVLPNPFFFLPPEGSLYIVMEDSTGKLYRVEITPEENSLVARLGSQEINKIEESKVLCLLHPKEDGNIVAITSKYTDTKYTDTSEKLKKLLEL